MGEVVQNCCDEVDELRLSHALLNKDFTYLKSDTLEIKKDVKTILAQINQFKGMKRETSFLVKIIAPLIGSGVGSIITLIVAHIKVF